MVGFEWLRSDRFAPRTLPRRLRHAPARARGAAGPDRRLADAAPARPEHGRRDARGRGREAARPARPARGRARVRQPLRPRAQLLARARPGLRRLHPRGARAAAVRPDRDRAQRERRRAGDGRRRCGRGRRAAAGLGPADPRDPARGAAAHEPDGLPARHELGGLPRGGRVPGARPALPARHAAAPGRPGDRDALARAQGAATPSAPTTSSSPACSAGWWQARCRTSAPTRASARRSTSCGASRRCGPTSSRSSPTSCARRWPP